MKYCPSCGTEYYDAVASCSECRSQLVNEHTWKKILDKKEKQNKDFFVTVKTVESQFEADVIKDALQKDNIPVLIKSFTDTSFNGLFIPQKGWGSVLVPEEDREKASFIIKALDTSG